MSSSSSSEEWRVVNETCCLLLLTLDACGCGCETGRRTFGRAECTLLLDCLRSFLASATHTSQPTS